MSQLIENLPEDIRQIIENSPGGITYYNSINDIRSPANYTIRPNEHAYIPYTCTFEMPPEKIEYIVHLIDSIPHIIISSSTVEEGVENATTLHIHNMTGSDYNIKEGDRIGQLVIPTSDSTGQ